MADNCTYHCRPCSSHFTSLRAFDAHRQGPSDDRRCEFPDSGLVELTGVCKLADPDMPLAGVTLHEHESAQDYRERMNAAHSLTASQIEGCGVTDSASSGAGRRERL
jgi:hypothetical protein